MKRERSNDLLVILGVLALLAYSVYITHRAVEVAPPEPTTVKFETLIVDQSGASFHAVLEVEREDVAVLITGEKWKFMRRIEEGKR